MNSDHITASTRSRTKKVSGTMVWTELTSSIQQCFLHAVLSNQKILVKNKTPVLAQQPYSPDFSSTLPYSHKGTMKGNPTELVGEL